MFTYAAIACLPFTFRDVVSIRYSALPMQTWLGIAYVVAFATFVSYICLSFAQQRLKPTALMYPVSGAHASFFSITGNPVDPGITLSRGNVLSARLFPRRARRRPGAFPGKRALPGGKDG